ncbi:MAG TPA: glycosyl hydrolase family 28 protein [Bryobacteraceae bacterium]|nr:glycosyl hydrolase family 28 protein [Bryobacteraceae bacterium]
MPSKDPTSRRRWLQRASAASLGAGLLSGQTAPATSAASGTRVYNIVDFGAKGDGQTLSTAALQAAIDACTADHGGVVLVPAGVFVIGTVEMKSNVTLRIAAGGKLLGSADGKQYYAAKAIPLTGDSTLNDGNVGLIFGVNADNVTIEGPGTIDGQGLQFRSPARGTPPPSGRGGADRPYHLLFHRCKNLRVRDLTLLESAFHSIRVIQSTYVWMDGLHIHNRVNSNNDGFHFISSEFVHVTNCDIQTQDDACALFGTCRFVTVSDSTFSTRWSVFRFGGGNPENVTVTNCVIYQTYGCPIKMEFGPANKVQNLVFSNLVLEDVTGPIMISVGNRRPRNAPPDAPIPQNPQTGYVRNISFRAIRAHVVSEGGQFEDIPFNQSYRPGETRQCIDLNATGTCLLEGIELDDVRVTYGGGGTAEEAAREFPPIAGPEYFDMGTPPAYGLYGRNVRNLTLNNVRFEVDNPDLRPAIVLDHASDAALTAVAAQGNPQAKSVIRLIDSQDVLITSPRVLTPAAAFLSAEGASKSITVEGGDISKAEVPVRRGTGVTVKVRE